MNSKDCSFGFSLIEFLVYLMASSMICLLLSNWVVNALYANVIISQKNNVQLSILTTIDCCTRDIMCAPSHKSAWIKTEPQYILWHQLGQAVGYQFDKQQIIRVAGRYNAVTRTVYKKTYSQVVAQVADCQYTLKKNGDSVVEVGIQFSIKKGIIQSECSRNIVLRNH